MKKLILSVVAFAGLAALSPAPINMGNVPANKIEPEKSDSVRSTEQTGAMMGEVGSVPPKEGHQIAPPIDVQNKGAENIARASSAKIGENAVKQASKDMETAKGSKGFPWLTAILVLVGGFGVFQFFKIWANKNLPEPGKFK
jgi:hypothetical protein